MTEAKVCRPMRKHQTPEAKSPVDTSHPCAKHIGFSTTTESRRSHSTFSRKARDCCMSAQRRLNIRMTNWFVRLDLMRQRIKRYPRRKRRVTDATKERKPSATTARSQGCMFGGTFGNVDESLSCGGYTTISCSCDFCKLPCWSNLTRYLLKVTHQIRSQGCSYRSWRRSHAHSQKMDDDSNLPPERDPSIERGESVFTNSALVVGWT